MPGQSKEKLHFLLGLLSLLGVELVPEVVCSVGGGEVELVGVSFGVISEKVLLDVGLDVSWLQGLRLGDICASATAESVKWTGSG